jgi:hypothetical protein
MKNCDKGNTEILPKMAKIDVEEFYFDILFDNLEEIERIKKIVPPNEKIALADLAALSEKAGDAIISFLSSKNTDCFDIPLNDAINAAISGMDECLSVKKALARFIIRNYAIYTP